MKKNLLVASLLIFSFLFVSNGINTLAEEEYILDYKDPKNIVEAIFYAAKTGDIDIMSNLCDPKVYNDEAVEKLCFIEINDRVIRKFTNDFINGKVVGEVEYEQSYAKVKVTGIKNSTRVKTFTLIKRYGNWFLYSFR
jgi:hypothetical protein